MKKAVKIGIGVGVAGLSGLSIFTILKQRKLAKQAFDAEFSEDEMTNDVKDSASENQVPEFTKYTGISVEHVTNMLNAVTKKNDRNGYYIEAKDFEAIRESLGVFDIYIHDNYGYWKEKVYGEMISFRIEKDFCVSNDGWFLVSGKWQYLSKDEVLDDYIRVAQCRERLYDTNECSII